MTPNPVIRTHWRREVRRLTIVAAIITMALAWEVYGR